MSYIENNYPNEREQSAQFHDSWKYIRKKNSPMDRLLFAEAGMPGYDQFRPVPDIPGVSIRDHYTLAPNTLNGKHGIFLAAPSYFGKDGLEKYIRRVCPGLISPVVTATTRPQRDDEIDGVDQIFLSQEQFQEWKDAGRLLEYHQVRPPHWFGIPYDSIHTAMQGGPILVFKIDIQGIEDVKPKIDMILPTSTAGLIRNFTLNQYKNALMKNREDGYNRYETAKRELYRMGEIADILLENPWEPDGIPTIAGESLHRVLHLLSNTVHHD